MSVRCIRLELWLETLAQRNQECGVIAVGTAENACGLGSLTELQWERAHHGLIDDTFIATAAPAPAGIKLPLNPNRAGAISALSLNFIAFGRARKSSRWRCTNASRRSFDSVSTEIGPLGRHGPSKKDLEDVAAVVAHSFFVATFDAQRKRPPPQGSLRKIVGQVYDDLAMRYTAPGGSACLLIARRAAQRRQAQAGTTSTSSVVWVRELIRKDGNGGFQLVGNAIKTEEELSIAASKIDIYSQKEDGRWVKEAKMSASLRDTDAGHATGTGPAADAGAVKSSFTEEAVVLYPEKSSVVGCVGLEVMPFEELPVSSPARVSSIDASFRRFPRQRVAYMSNLSVLQSARRQGLGRQLILKAEEWARDVFRVQEVLLMVCSDNVPAQHLYECLGYLQIFQDPWAVRAVPADNGEIDRIRVMNFGYSKGLSKVPEERSPFDSARQANSPNLAQMLSRTWSSLASQLGMWKTCGNGSNSRETEELAFDLQKSDFIVAVEQAAVGNSGSLGAQLLFITASSRTLYVVGQSHRKREPLPSRVRADVHAGEQIVGLQVEFGRIIGVETALEPAVADCDSDLQE
ncbi:hypothetical protein AK812_SmicGene6755 [Symbiodinium microadriaticum]|uniref:N-acetyltransferase domain-containing protein n=1 Tax=Symbiodinium microadriaticum TaxID=2951 RepID=A0A1Q9EQF6_SYMMI|nr:hypothetical protein AK812_SmicGene6755 [Symbiodinium microadriaticum]